MIYKALYSRGVCNVLLVPNSTLLEYFPASFSHIQWLILVVCINIDYHYTRR